jgi:hypothetical protein
MSEKKKSIKLEGLEGEWEIRAMGDGADAYNACELFDMRREWIVLRRLPEPPAMPDLTMYDGLHFSYDYSIHSGIYIGYIGISSKIAVIKDKGDRFCIKEHDIRAIFRDGKEIWRRPT